MKLRKELGLDEEQGHTHGADEDEEWSQVGRGEERRMQGELCLQGSATPHKLYQLGGNAWLQILQATLAALQEVVCWVSILSQNCLTCHCFLWVNNPQQVVRFLDQEPCVHSLLFW